MKPDPLDSLGVAIFVEEAMRRRPAVAAAVLPALH
jgi:hypothetical protein